MKEMTTYALEVLVCSGVLLSVYAILLDRQIKFRWCRIYLLVAMVSAALIPALQIPVWPGEVIVATTPFAAEPLPEGWVAEPVAEPAFEITSKVICTGIYLLGAALILGLMVWQAIRIHGLRRGAEITHTDRFSLICTPKKIASFSFFRSIFIWNRTPAEELPAIIAHESSHIAHRHSVERIAMECLKAAMWWNPFVWIASRRLTEVEEYEADSDVLNSGYDIQSYMQILLKQLFGYTPEIANGLRDSLTKKRFKMMTSNTNSRHSLLRLAGTLPAIAGLLCVFGFTTRAAVVQTPESAPTVGSPAAKELVEVRTTTISQQPQAPENTKMCKVQIQVYAAHKEGSVFRHDPIQGAAVVIVNTDTGVTTDKQGRATIIAQRGNTLKVIYLGYEPVYVQVNDAEEMVCDVRLPSEGERVATSTSLDKSKQPIWIVDGVEVGGKYINSIAPNQIDQISVIKDKTSTAQYGERGANGAVIITTKQGAAHMTESERKEIKKTTATGRPISDDEPFITSEVMPSFEGGDLNTFREWVQSHIVYPAEMLKNGVQGRVTLSFVIERDGSVGDIQVLQTPDRALSEEARRVVLSSPKWTPGQQRGQAVRVRYTLPVDFKIMGGKAEKPEADAVGAENRPKFQNGGITEFRRWVQMQVKYPTKALNEGSEGRVVVEFTVGKTGKVRPGKVLQTSDRALSEEVLRVVKQSPDWTPGTEKGKAVNVKYAIPIEFKISGSQGNLQKKVEGNIPEIIVVGCGPEK